MSHAHQHNYNRAFIIGIVLNVAWGMSTTENALTAHLVKPETDDDDVLIKQAGKELYEKFGIHHVTLQWERDTDLRPCKVYRSN